MKGAFKSIQRRSNYRTGKAIEGCAGGCLLLPFQPFIWLFKKIFK